MHKGQVDFHEKARIGKYFRDNSSVDGVKPPSSSGSMADRAKSNENVPTNRGGNPNDPSLNNKGLGEGTNKTANKTKATSNTTGRAAKQLKNNPVTKGLNVAADAKELKDIAKNEGAGAAAAAGATKGAKLAASATGVGRIAVAAINEAQNRINKIGRALGANKDIASDKNLFYAILFIGFLSILPVLILFAVVFFAWRYPWQVLKLSFTNTKTFVGIVKALAIEDGAANKMAFEVDKKGNGTALAAPQGNVPEQGTYEYKLSQIDWEKAKFKTIPADSRCVIKTKKVVSTIDGKERSVIESVTINSQPGQELEGVARANCINNSYPIFNTMMRSRFIRDGINNKLRVRYAYAEPQDAATLKQPTVEFRKTLRDKTLTRIWNRGSQVQDPTQATPEEVKKMNDLVSQKFDGTRTVNTYTAGKYPQSVVDCANNFIPPNEPQNPSNTADLKNFYQKNIDKMTNDLKCGIDPKDLQLYTTFPAESDVSDPDPQTSGRPKRAALQVVCIMNETLLTEGGSDNYKDRVKNRINSAAAAGWQAMTLADTHQARWISLQELGGDFYKIAGMQAGQEYSHTLDGKKLGTPLEPDAVSRAIGYYNRSALPFYSSSAEQTYVDGLNKVTEFLNNNPDVCNSIRDTIYSAAELAIIDNFWTNYYPTFKRAMAGLDFYSRTVNTQSISDIYKNLSYDDILFRLVRLESNSATAGTEDGPQNFNRMNFGMKAYNNALSLSLGGRFLSDREAAMRDQQNWLAIDFEAQSRGLTWRLFGSDNPSSLTNRVAVAMIDYPQNIPGNIMTALGRVLSPIGNAAGERGSLTAILTGKSRAAQAASTSYDVTNLKLDPAGMTDDIARLNQIENARYIEQAKKNNPTKAVQFTRWDQCFTELIPSSFHLFNPPADKKDLYENDCQPLFRANRDPNSDATRYAAYHFAMLQADALIYLSDPNKEDINLNAISSQNSSNAPAAPPEAPPTGGTPTGAAGDTSAQQCPPGTQDAGIGEKYGVGKVLQYRIRLCNVQGITVNVSVAANLNNLLTAAKSAGINLSGSGYRTFDQQVQLRTTNGCANVFTAPSSSCSPQTARPGESNHESGEAVDFKQNGATLRPSSSGFSWMKANANRYQFFNLPSESWHWSKDGK